MKFAGEVIMEPSLHSYAERVRHLPMLDESQERALAYRWQNEGDQQARNVLVQSQLRFVLFVAHQYCRSGSSLSELVAEGNLGLLHAANKFDPTRGFRFFTYAKHWVRVFVSECAGRGASCIARNSRSLRRARRELSRVTNLVGEGPQLRPLLAQRLNVNLAEVDLLLGLLGQQEVPFETLGAERRAIDAALCSPEASPEQEVLREAELRLRKTVIRDALGTLDPRERRIADRRLMVDPESMLTLKELGQEFGVSRERVRQLESRLKRKLAEQLSTLRNAQARGANVAA
jgi:RNA polymerase sigma-32 factor